MDRPGVMNSLTGPGDRCVAQDLYRTAILGELGHMRREGVYVSMDNIMARMLRYNQEILWGVLWALALEGGLS